MPRELARYAKIALVVAITLSVPSLAQALPVTPTFNWRAAAPGADPSTSWEATIGSHQWAVSGATQTAPVTGYPGITETFTLGGADSITGVSFQSIATGNPSNEDVSLELWFRPASLSGGQQILFETGGGGPNSDGLSLLLDDNLLILRVKDNGNIATTTAYDLGSDASEFFQAAITVSRNDTASLYVNGLLAASASAAGINDWTSNNAAALGGQSGGIGGNAGDLNGYGNFTGDIALFRFYRDQVLTAGEVAQNFDAVATPEPGTAVLVALGLVGLAARRRFLAR